MNDDWSVIGRKGKREIPEQKSICVNERSPLQYKPLSGYENNVVLIEQDEEGQILIYCYLRSELEFLQKDSNNNLILLPFIRVYLNTKTPSFNQAISGLHKRFRLQLMNSEEGLMIYELKNL